MSKLIYGKVQKMTCILLAVIAVFFCQRIPALASSVDAVNVSSAPLERAVITKNGMVRVYLASLGNPSVLDLTVKGSYSLSTNGEFVARGTKVKISFSSSTGMISVTYNGKTIQAGQTITLRRHQANGENGILIAQAYESQNLYPGDLSFEAVYSNGSYTLYTVAHIYMENYLYGVLPYEMSNSSGAEALKAQAVAARTYTVRMMQQRSSGRYDVKDTTADQVYRGTPSGNSNCVAAVDATKGIVLMNGSSYVTTYYSASNGGQTEIARTGTRYSYMKVKDDPFDLANPNSAVKEKTIYTNLQHSSNPQALLNALKLKAVESLKRSGYPATSENTVLQTLQSVAVHTPMYAFPSRLYTQIDFTYIVSTKTSSGQTVSVPVTTTFGVFDELESILGMSFQSAQNELWSVVQKDSGFALQVRRYGHGMGMSQRGAMYMAKLGYTYDEILGFYFEGCSRVQHSFSNTILGSGSADQETNIEPPVDSDGTTGREAVVKTQSGSGTVNLRQGKSTSSRVIAQLPAGSTVMVLSDEGEWCRISSAAGTGYMMSDFIQYAANNEPETTEVLAVVATQQGTLNLRSQPSTSAKVLATIPKGAQVVVTSRADDWCAVRYHDHSGYVMSSFLLFETDASDDSENAAPDAGAVAAKVVTPSGSLNLREQPNAGAAVLKQIPRETLLSISQRGAEWCRTEYQSVGGYVMTKFLVFNEEQTDGPETNLPAESVTAYVNTQNGTLNLRKLPTANALVLTTLPQNAVVTVTDRGDEWCAVAYGSYSGYVMTKFLAFDEETPEEPEVSVPPEGVAAYVDTQSGALNLRKLPMANALVLTTIPQRATVTVTDRGDEWCAVTYGSYSGYVMTKFLAFDELETEAVNGNMWVATQSGPLNMRESPSVGSRLLTTIPRGASVTILEEKNAWYRVEYGSYRGYVMARFLSENAPSNREAESSDTDEQPEEKVSAITFAETALYERQDRDAESICLIPAGIAVELLMDGTEWCCIRYQGTVGYCLAENLNVSYE